MALVLVVHMDDILICSKGQIANKQSKEQWMIKISTNVLGKECFYLDRHINGPRVKRFLTVG